MNKFTRVSVLFAAVALTALAGCSSTARHESTGQYIDDTAITTAVKAKFVEDKSVDAGAIKVETLNGTVALSGFAKSNAEKAQAGAYAPQPELGRLYYAYFADGKPAFGVPTGFGWTTPAAGPTRSSSPTGAPPSRCPVSTPGISLSSGASGRSRCAGRTRRRRTGGPVVGGRGFHLDRHRPRLRTDPGRPRAQRLCAGCARPGCCRSSASAARCRGSPSRSAGGCGGAAPRRADRCDRFPATA